MPSHSRWYSPIQRHNTVSAKGRQKGWSRMHLHHLRHHSEVINGKKFETGLRFRDLINHKYFVSKKQLTLHNYCRCSRSITVTMQVDQSLQCTKSMALPSRINTAIFFFEITTLVCEARWQSEERSEWHFQPHTVYLALCVCVVCVCVVCCAWPIKRRQQWWHHIIVFRGE